MDYDKGQDAPGDTDAECCRCGNHEATGVCAECLKEEAEDVEAYAEAVGRIAREGLAAICRPVYVSTYRSTTEERGLVQCPCCDEWVPTLVPSTYGCGCACEEAECPRCAEERPTEDCARHHAESLRPTPPSYAGKGGYP